MSPNCDWKCGIISLYENPNSRGQSNFSHEHLWVIKKQPLTLHGQFQPKLTTILGGAGSEAEWKLGWKSYEKIWD